VSIVRAVLEAECYSAKRIVEDDRLLADKSISAKIHLKTCFTADQGEATAHAIARDHADGLARLLHHAAIGVEAENWIVTYDGRSRPQCTSKPEVDLA